MQDHPDIVVVGGGHAGVEAAAAAARMGQRVILLTFDASRIGQLSCNPAIGGLAKGCLVRELDALGGLMARAVDATTVQFRQLNTRKGLAVRSSRAQVDTREYPLEIQRLLGELEGLSVLEGEARGLLLGDAGVRGVRLADGRELICGKVILTTGTFLGGLLHRGAQQQAGGRIGERSASRLSRDLLDAGLRLGRLKTGTPPRLAARSIDWSRLLRQERHQGRMSFTPTEPRTQPLDCHVAYTNPRTHQLIRDNLHTSAMYSGSIEGTGPRYCPSIEDKIARFGDRERHQLFLEREGHHTDRIYLSGLSTSLPESVQVEVVRSIAGLEGAEILQWGYAVEYDFSDPRDLDHGMQHSSIPGLFLAGQISGTSGYEEAAVQGLIAGVSAARGEPFVLGREQAYIGVLIDDLVTRGVGGEPYRMFSSRAEHRLLLREDNADRRLRPIGYDLGLVGEADMTRFREKQARLRQARDRLASSRAVPDQATLADMERLGLGGLKKPVLGEELMRRPEASYAALAELLGLPELSSELAEQVETDVKYAGYIRRQQARASQARRLGGASLLDLDYSQVPSLSNEVRERLQRARPRDLRSASRLPGITPAAIDVLTAFVASRRSRT